MSRKILLGDLVFIDDHQDESIVGMCGRVTAVTNMTASVWIDENKQTVRQVPLSDLELVRKTSVGN